MKTQMPFPPAFRGRFGVARRDITPPIGIYSRNWGAAKSDVAVSIHRPMTLTVLLMGSSVEKESFALLSLDLGWFRSSAEEKVLADAVEAAGILEGRYLIALTHTHSGPVFCPGDSEKPGGEWIEEYLQSLAEKIQDAIREASGNQVSGLLETATGSCRLAANRDFLNPETDRLLVGWNPAVEADETLMFGRVSDESGKTLATLVNYACHPTILAWENTAISPDFVGATREVVEEQTKCPCLFLQGASGDLAARHQYVGDPDIADKAGRSLGYAALSVFFGMTDPGCALTFEGPVESGAALAIWRPRARKTIPGEIFTRRVRVDLTIKSALPSLEELEENIANCPDRVERERLQRRVLQRRSLGQGTVYPAVHEIWKLGDILFVSVANEAYSALQVRLREKAGKTPVFVVTIANGSRGYLSPSESYALHSYASTQSPFADGCFEQTLHQLETEIQSLL